MILDSGRSGTSIAARTLAKVGRFMGERLHKPRESNPKGFLEGPEINGINLKGNRGHRLIFERYV